MPNPPLLAAQLLTQALLARGVAVSRSAASLEVQQEGKRTLLYTHYSPPLRKIVERANQESVNLYCEALLMAIGKKKLGEGSRVAGLQAIRLIWAERGLSFDEAILADGSGLSPLNRLSSYQLAQLIRKIYADP
ncbi:D-alanyl-D-alanine carboxypeptidase, partial [Arthrospira platensis SPKY1]|nr:D-alanyl-D-alanine carboxypeptidase [Arthrospira platensis SPKY1]